MNVQKNDWLDEKLARTDYLPDDGFTVRVMEQLPKKRPARTMQLRWVIIATSSLIAFSLFVLQAVSFVRNFNPLAFNRYFSPHLPDHLVISLPQPGVLYSVAAAILVASFAAIPFLKRWV